MKYMVRELRDMTGMTQKAFAEWYGIPLSTLRKWEQGEASPPPYVITLLARAIPATNDMLQEIKGKEGKLFFYDKRRKKVYDQKGNGIIIKESLDGVKEQNLKIYLQELFDDFYDIQEKFNRDCCYDKEEDIIWS